LADVVFKFEKRLAIASMDRMELRDPQKTYHKMKVTDLAQIAPAIDWSRYFEQLQVPNPDSLVVSQPDFVTEVSKMINDVPVEEWKAYFAWNLMNDASPYLSSAFVNESFDFYGKVLYGIEKQRPRWKKVLQATNGSLSEALGEIYVAKYFPPEAKTRMLQLVGNLKIALGERIQHLDWMSDTTKTNALAKLNAMNVKIGYPDKWKDYSTLEVKDDAYILNLVRASKFGFRDMVTKINKPVDKTLWHMSPQTVNAYYNPVQNEIVFPAAILQPPFFYLDGDDAVNYGAIGVVIGHEMTHGFDNRGRQYDKEGNLKNWWTAEDEKRFNERTQVLVKRFNNFIVLDTVHANGQYTLGENIADLGGLNISYTAFTKTKQWQNQTNKIAGFTPDQRFFLSFAKVWAELVRDEQILEATQTDVHSLGRFRVQGPLPNMPEFIAAFDAKPGDTYYLADSLRAKIW
jgi:putative endopeptidase